MPKGVQTKLNKIMSTIAYKGFHTNMTCRGFSYKEGETYYEPNAKLCKCGFHAYKNPIDIFVYYAPGNSVFHKVLLDGVTADKSYDTKICGDKITILQEISFQALASLCEQHTIQRCKETKNSDIGGLSIAENESSAAISGEGGKSIVENRSVAKAEFQGIAVAGNYSIAKVKALGMAVAANYSIAITGNNGIASTKNYGISISQFGGQSLSGFRGAAISGDNGMSMAGYEGYAEAGEIGLACSGLRGIASSGNNGFSVSQGKSNTGKDGLAVAKGQNVKVKGDIGAILVIAEEDYNDKIKHFATAIVGQNGIEPNTWYKLNDKGQFVKDI